MEDIEETLKKMELAGSAEGHGERKGAGDKSTETGHEAGLENDGVEGKDDEEEDKTAVAGLGGVLKGDEDGKKLAGDDEKGEEKEHGAVVEDDEDEHEHKTVVKNDGNEKIVKEEDEAGIKDGEDATDKHGIAEPQPLAGPSAIEAATGDENVEDLSDAEFPTEALPQDRCEADSDLDYEHNPVKDTHKPMPSNVDPALGIRFMSKTKTASKHGLHIIKKRPKSVYENVTFIDCKFQATGTTTFLDCQLRNVTFEDCRFKNVNRFDDMIATNTEFHGVKFDGYWNDKTYDGDVVVHQPELHQRPLAPRQPPPPVWDDRDPRLDEFFHYNSLLERVRQPAGLKIEGGEHEFYYLVNFLACTFDAKNPTVFKNCALQQVTFKNCHFSGSRFVNYYAFGLKVNECTFHDSKFVNVDGEEVRYYGLPQRLKDDFMELSKLKAKHEEELAKKKKTEEESKQVENTKEEGSKEEGAESSEKAAADSGEQEQQQEPVGDETRKIGCLAPWRTSERSFRFKQRTSTRPLHHNTPHTTCYRCLDDLVDVGSMENDIRKLLDRLLLNPRTEGDEPTNSTSPVAATEYDAAAAAADSEGDSGSDLDGGADLGNLTDDDRAGDSGVLVPALPSRPSNVGELPDVCFKKCDELIFPPEHGLTISTEGRYTRYFCLTFIDCQFESSGMTTFAGCQLNFVTFEGCTFKGVNQFINIIGDGLCYTKCTFDNHWETNLRHDSNIHLVSLTFEGTRHNGYLDQSEADWRSDLVKEQEREFDSWSKHPRVPGVIHTEDEDGIWKSGGRGLMLKDNREHELYREVYFINCTFDASKPTIFDNCVLDAVTFKNGSFSGSRFENFYAKGLKATNCTFNDCQYVNVARPDHEVLNAARKADPEAVESDGCRRDA
ncbi:hypothetical protein M409DRAFT_53430 [Zasmidium cellare ATCC 36951]|uniref:Uncharacterized protein n=1 Tax=Zasmidium cellare ATCC 36951 TaxID=1080233 RepID=A0A6A6CLQ2_ZASCE|nr:uncharacterized protein M409DRAFT_53430 [Zasmidium cellare ATCC 36951]KAF2168114.1 hypothetical protein M409DRAFT_53430 [Zasmidium cellare ATCC 36951]